MDETKDICMSSRGLSPLATPSSSRVKGGTPLCSMGLSPLATPSSSRVKGGTPLCDTPLCDTPLCDTPLCGTSLCKDPRGLRPLSRDIQLHIMFFLTEQEMVEMVRVCVDMHIFRAHPNLTRVIRHRRRMKQIKCQEYVQLLTESLFKLNWWMEDKGQMNMLTQMFEAIHYPELTRQERQLHFISGRRGGKTCAVAAVMAMHAIFGGQEEHCSFVASCAGKMRLKELQGSFKKLYIDFPKAKPVPVVSKDSKDSAVLTIGAKGVWNIGSNCSIRWVLHDDLEKKNCIQPNDIVLIDDLFNSLDINSIQKVSNVARAVFSTCRDYVWNGISKEIKAIIWKQGLVSADPIPHARGHISCDNTRHVFFLVSPTKYADEQVISVVD